MFVPVFSQSDCAVYVRRSRLTVKGGRGVNALSYLQRLSFHGSTCAFQTNLGTQKSVSQLSPLVPNDMQTGCQPTSQMQLIRGVVEAENEQRGITSWGKFITLMKPKEMTALLSAL